VTAKLSMLLEKDVAVTMRDGAVLRANGGIPICFCR